MNNHLKHIRYMIKSQGTDEQVKYHKESKE
jgi:hypothetical protein